MATEVETMFAEIERLQLLSSRDFAALRSRWFKPTRSNPADMAKFSAWLRANSHLSGFAIDLVARGQGDQLVWNQYRIRSQLNSGPLAGAYVAADPLQKLVDIQVATDAAARDAGRMYWLQEVVEKGIRIHHSNVCGVREFSKAHDRYFLVREHYEAETLAGILKQRGKISPELAARIFSLACDGLAALHEKEVPGGTLSADCILLTAMGTGPHHQRTVRILVAGVRPDIFDTKAVGNLAPSSKGPAIPEKLEMRPVSGEISLGAGFQPAEDLFRLGCTFYLALTGREPFPASASSQNRQPARPAAEVNPDVPMMLSQIVEQMIEIEPAKRPLKAAHVAKALRVFLRSAEEEKVVREEDRVVMPQPAPETRMPRPQAADEEVEFEADEEFEEEASAKPGRKQPATEGPSNFLTRLGELWADYQPEPRDAVLLGIGSVGTIILILLIEFISGFRFVHVALLASGAAITLLIERLVRWYEARETTSAPEAGE